MTKRRGKRAALAAGVVLCLVEAAVLVGSCGLYDAYAGTSGKGVLTALANGAVLSLIVVPLAISCLLAWWSSGLDESRRLPPR